MWLILSHPLTICTDVFFLYVFQLRPGNSELSLAAAICFLLPWDISVPKGFMHKQHPFPDLLKANRVSSIALKFEVLQTKLFHRSSAGLAYLIQRSQGMVHNGLCRERVHFLLCLEIIQLTAQCTTLRWRPPNHPGTAHIYHFYTNNSWDGRVFNSPTFGQI